MSKINDGNPETNMVDITMIYPNLKRNVSLIA